VLVAVKATTVQSGSEMYLAPLKKLQIGRATALGQDMLYTRFVIDGQGTDKGAPLGQVPFTT
jgi:hypothetical protein